MTGKIGGPAAHAMQYPDINSEDSKTESAAPPQNDTGDAEKMRDEQRQASMLNWMNRLDSAEGIEGVLLEIQIALKDTYQELRALMRQERNEASRAQIEQLHKEAAELIKAAEFNLAAGISSGAITIAGAAAQAGMGMKATSASGQAIKANRSAAEIESNLPIYRPAVRTRMQERVNDLQLTAKGNDMRAQVHISHAQAIGQGTQGLAQVASSALKFGADSHEAESRKRHADATRDEAAYNDANELQRQWGDEWNNAKQQGAAVNTQYVETRKSIINRI